MNRISRDELRMIIHVALTVRRKAERARVDLLGESTVESFTDDLLQRIMGREASETILITPSDVGTSHSPKRGAWNVDEPHPHPDLPFRFNILPRARAGGALPGEGDVEQS